MVSLSNHEGLNFQAVGFFRSPFDRLRANGKSLSQQHCPFHLTAIQQAFDFRIPTVCGETRAGQDGIFAVPGGNVGRNKPALAGVSGTLTGRVPETVAARPYSGLRILSSASRLISGVSNTSSWAWPNISTCGVAPVGSGFGSHLAAGLLAFLSYKPAATSSA